MIIRDTTFRNSTRSTPHNVLGKYNTFCGYLHPAIYIEICTSHLTIYKEPLMLCFMEQKGLNNVESLGLGWK